MFIFALVLPFIVFAQAAIDPAAALDPVQLLTAGVRTLAESAQSKNWALFIPTLVVLIVTGVRWIGKKLAAEGTKFRAFLDNKWTKWGMNFVTTFAGAFIGAATMKVAISPSIVVNGFLMAFAAAGGVEFFRDVVDGVAVKKATTAGDAAAKGPGGTLNS